MATEPRTKADLIGEAHTIQNALQSWQDRLRYGMGLEERIGQLEINVSNLMQARRDDLRERAEALPKENGSS